MSEIPLLPCPFQSPHFEKHVPELVLERHTYMRPMYQVQCACGASGPNHDEKEYAIRDWNRRASGQTKVVPGGGVLHASAPFGMKCSDCTMDNEPCPTCYAAWWAKRHPNVEQV